MNLIVVGVFVAWNQIPPRLNWLLLVPLLLEFYVFVLGVSLILATLFVRFRDIGQVWELATQLILYATPIIYPVGFLPEWAPYDRVPQPDHPGPAGRPRDRSLPGRRAEPDHRDTRRSTPASAA